MKPIRALSPTQREVATLVAQGMSYPTIGRELGMSPRTVRAHVAAIVLRLPPAAGVLPNYKRVMIWASANPAL